MVYFQNPENALKRAKEFIEVGKKTDALEVLHEVLRMRRHRQYQVSYSSLLQLFDFKCSIFKTLLSAIAALLPPPSA